MEAATPRLHLVDTRTGEVTDDQATLRELHDRVTSLTGVITSRDRTITELRKELAVERAAAKWDWPVEPAIETVGRYWTDLVMQAGWYTRPPAFGPATTRWKDTKRALDGVKTRQGWTYPPRSVAELLSASCGAAIRGEEQRRDPRFKRDYLDPCTAFFTNFDRNYEASTDPAPSRQTRARMAFEAPAALRERWGLVESLADECGCGHCRLDHQRDWLGLDDTLESGGCLVHGCHCEAFDDTDFKAQVWWDDKTAQLKRHPGRCDVCQGQVTVEQWSGYEVGYSGGFFHYACVQAART